MSATAPGDQLDRALATTLATLALRVDPGTEVHLEDWPTRVDVGVPKDQVLAATAVLNARLEDLQERLYADGRHKALVVLQATDTGGKDGTIRNVFDGVNPTGVRVASFKKPTDHELAHDYLWRVHQQTPGNGEIVIFNRSHYEDVLIVRVHNLVPKSRWEKRYGHIRHFEQLLADEGTLIVKLFLHISKDEQRQRLQDRVDTPEKQWKFALADLDERKHWASYQRAYATMLTETSTAHAPWYVIPSDAKKTRDLLVSYVLVEALSRLDLRYPEPEPGVTGLVVK